MPANLAPPPCPDTAFLQLAGLLVPAHEASRWFHHDPIDELGGWTAAQLSWMQRQPQVIAFLQSVLCGERGSGTLRSLHCAGLQCIALP